MSCRPVLAHRPDGHSAQRVAGRRMANREIEMARKQAERDEHQAVVEDDRAREPKPRVALAEPEEDARNGEEDRERRRERRVQLLAGVEPALRRGPLPEEPADV